MRSKALGAVMVVLVLLVSGCTSDPQRRKPDSAASPSPSEPPRGRIDFGVLGEPATLDPYSPLASDLTFMLVRPIYPSLFRFQPDGSVAEDLAESLTEVAGGVSVDLRPTLWSTGKPVTSRDVVASAARARPPSGFASMKATARDRDTVEFRGDVSDWKAALATVAFVLPGGRSQPSVSGGPLRLVDRVPGLRLDLEPNPQWEGSIGFRRLRVFNIEDASTMRSLLGSGGLDAGALPSSVNLVERLEAENIHFSSATGWESIRLDLGMGDLDAPTQTRIAAAVDRAALAEGFIRSLGTVTNTLHPGPSITEGSYERPEGDGGAIRAFSLGVPRGDELLALLQRALQLQLAAAGARVDLAPIEARVFYGTWRVQSPVAAGLLRLAGGPWSPTEENPVPRGMVPLFSVATFIAGNGVAGYEANPTFEGPFWNVQDWRPVDRE